MHSQYPSHLNRSGQTKTVVMVAILIVALAAAAWLWSRPASQPSLDAGRGIAEAFLQQLRDGHPDAAWESSTAEFKSAQGKESFVRQAKTKKYQGAAWEFVSTQTVQIGDQPRAEFLFRSADGATLRLVLGREAGVWKVDRLAQ